MDSEKIDIERVRTLYNQMDDIWPASDKWYTYTHQQMIRYIDGFKKKYLMDLKWLLFASQSPYCHFYLI